MSVKDSARFRRLGILPSPMEQENSNRSPIPCRKPQAASAAIGESRNRSRVYAVLSQSQIRRRKQRSLKIPILTKERRKSAGWSSRETTCEQHPNKAFFEAAASVGLGSRIYKITSISVSVDWRFYDGNRYLNHAPRTFATK